MSNQVKIDSLSQTQLDNYIVNQLYLKINEQRELFQVPKLYHDTSAQTAIQNYLFRESNFSKIVENDIETDLQKENFFSKNKKIIELNKILRLNLQDRNNLLNGFFSLIEENSLSKKNILMENNCFTHIGLNIKYEEQLNKIYIICILSQKIISVEESYTLKEGFIVVGSILVNDCYIAAAKIIKNDKSYYDIGPRNLVFNSMKMKYGIILPSVNFKDLGIRKIKCYCLMNQNNVNVPYLNNDARASTVKWESLEIGICQIINFKEGKDFSKISFKDFLKNEFNIENFTGFSTNKSNNSKLELINKLNKGRNINPNFFNNSNNNNIIISTPSRNSNNFNNKFIGNLSSIPEEKKNNLNQSFFSNNKLINSPIPKCINNNDFLGSLNNNNNNFQNIIGSKLQRAEELNGNINNIRIDNNKNITSFNINSHDISFSGNNNPLIPNQNNNINQNNTIFGFNNNNINDNNIVNYCVTKNQNNNMNNNNNLLNNNIFSNPNSKNNNNLFQQQFNTNSNLTNQNNPINNQNINNNIFSQNIYYNKYYPTNYLEYFKTYKIISNVLSWQIIPIELKYKNLLDIKGVGQHFPNEQIKLSFKHNDKILINLSQINSGNLQTYSINPQTKEEFMKLFLEEVEKNKSTKEDIFKFINGNLKICIEDSYGKMHILTNDNYLDLISKIKMNNIFTNILNNNNNSKKQNSNKSKPTISFFKQIIKEKSNKENNTNHFSLDNYIFKDMNISQKKNQESSNSKSSLLNSFVAESFNDKILQYITKKYLTKEESKIPYNYNKSYEELYHKRNFCDIILCIKGEEIYSHKVVLISSSPIFKNMIKANESNNNNFSNEILKIILPESYNIKIFKEIFKWIYCGQFHDNISIEDMREILLMAENLKMYSLQKILIIKYIIPNMTKESALIFLKDTYKKQISKETIDCWNLLAHFSINCISKNSSSLVKSNSSQFLTMDVELLIKVIENSVNYLVEEIHLSLLLKLLISKGYANDIFELINKISNKFKMCRNFDIQNINIESIFIEHNDNNPFFTYLINEETVNKCEIDSKGNYNENKNNIFTSPFYLSNSKIGSINKDNNSFNTRLSNYNKLFSFGIDNNNLNDNIENNENIQIEEKSFSSLSPCINSNPDIDIKKNKNPKFEFSFQIDNTNSQRMSVFSEKFNTKNRCFCLKIDIDNSGDVSFFIVERGINNKHNYNMGYNLNFTSVLFDFSIRDISFEKSGVIFFSFVNDQYQIIGYKNFFNIKQLSKKNILNFIIYIKEFPLHSACLQYISDNFQPLFLDKKGKCDLKESIILKSEKNDKEKLGFLNLYSSDLTSILYNNNLRVDNENNVISALYIYCLNKDPKNIDNIMESIRYEFVDFQNMCTLARDHDTIKHCPSFKKRFTIELNERIKKLNKNNNENTNLDNNCFLKRFIKRKFYSSSDSICNLNISNELINFFLEKNHHDGYIDKVNKLKKEIENERKINDERMNILKKENAILNNDKMNLTREIKKMKYHSNPNNNFHYNQITSSIMNERQNNTINNFKDIVLKNAKNCCIF